MDEMTLLRELRSGIPAAGITPEAEAAFTARLNAEVAGGPAITRSGRGRLRPSGRDVAWQLSKLGGRHHWRFAVAAAMSIALAVGLIAGVGDRPGPDRPRTPGSGGRPVSAVLLAEMAAAVAAARPVVAASQWVYTKTVAQETTPAGLASVCRVKDAQGRTHDFPVPGLGALGAPKSGVVCRVWDGYSVAVGAGAAQPPVVGGKPMSLTGRGKIVTSMAPAATRHRTAEEWTTADSRRQASYSARGKLVVSAACACGLATYGTFGKLPSDPKALVRWAMRPPGGGGHYTTSDLAWNAFNGIEGTLMNYVLPPRVAAELYRALGDIPGVTVDQHAVDAADRSGPAFVLTDHGTLGADGTAELFLNPHTFQLTGYADRFPAQCQCPTPGTNSTAIVRQALVSGPGVRP